MLCAHPVPHIVRRSSSTLLPSLKEGHFASPIGSLFHGESGVRALKATVWGALEAPASHFGSGSCGTMQGRRQLKATAPFSWLRGGPARAMEHFGEQSQALRRRPSTPYSLGLTRRIHSLALQAKCPDAGVKCVGD